MTSLRGSRGARDHQQLSSPHRILPSPFCLHWLLPWCSGQPVPWLLPVDPGWGRRPGRWLWRNVTVWAGRATSFATSPLAGCSSWGRCQSCSSSPSPRRIRASPQTPQGTQVSASACPQEALPCPRLPSVVFISVFSLSHCAEPRVWGGEEGLCFINPISLVIQITLPKSEPGAHKDLTQTRSDPLGWQKLRAGAEVCRKGLRM